MTQRSEMGLEDMLEVLIPQGFPTFDEFRKNPDKYRNRADQLLESADTSTQSFRKALTKQKYCWRNTYLCDSLEKIERIAKEEGFTVDDLEMQPRVLSTTGTSQATIEIMVHFWPKAEFKAMGGVVANA